MYKAIKYTALVGILSLLLGAPPVPAQKQAQEPDTPQAVEEEEKKAGKVPLLEPHKGVKKEELKEGKKQKEEEKESWWEWLKKRFIWDTGEDME